MKIKINVKEEHIINGKCTNPYRCAIALAVRDIIPGAEIHYASILIDFNNIIVNNNMMPEDAQVKMHTFDNFDRFENHKRVTIVGKARLEHLQPFSFVVDVDESLIFPDKLLEEIQQIIEESKNVELVLV